MATRTEAEIVAERPDPVIAKLTELGFELEVIDWPGEDHTTIVAVALTELDPGGFFDHVADIVAVIDPAAFLMGTDVIEGTDPIRPGVTKRRIGRA
jgi:hypothetical protein